MTRHMIDPELLPALELFRPIPLEEATLPQLREMFRELIPPFESYAREDVVIERHVVPGPDGAPDVPVLLYRPADLAGPLPVLLHIHGGGYLIGSAEGSGPSNVRTAAELQCVVVSVDYRLSPETPAPGAVEDCYAVLAWLNSQAELLGVDPGRIAVGGESAGGGLAASLALLARDRGAYKLCFQMLIYPMADDRTCVRDDQNPHVGEFVWTSEYNAFGWKALLGCEPGSADVPPYAVPARAQDLSGLPPVYMSVGALDLFLEENLDYARRLLRAGVAVELHVYPGAFHGFEVAADAAVAQRAEAERRLALARAFARGEAVAVDGP